MTQPAPGRPRLVLAPELLEDVDDLLRPQRRALAALLRSELLSGDDIHKAIAEVTEVAARTLRVERVGVWKLVDDKSALDLVDLYVRGSAQHSRGVRITASDTPQYFEAIAKERSIAAHDACTDPRTSEFRATYLEPWGITSMLDAPILVRGEMRGVICHEHTGVARDWTPWEELLAATFADFIAMILAAEELLESRRALHRHRSELETLVEERTARLRQSEEDLRRMFEASPVALVLTRVNDKTVVEANERAAKTFGVPLCQVKGQRSVDYWVNPADRDTLLQRVSATGTVTNYVAELKRADGARFWGDIDAQLTSFGGQASLLVGVRDVTVQRNAERALQRSRDTLRTLFHAAPVPLVLTSLDDSVVRFCNERAATMFDTTAEEVIGRRAPDFYADAADRAEFVTRLRRDGRVDGFTVQLKSMQGRVFWAILNAAAFDLEGERVFMVGFQDLTEQKNVEEKLRELATIDGLTGAYNRRTFFERAEAEILRADRYGGALSIAMLDADHFKKINDRFGHAVGDAALQHITGVLRGGLRRSDTVARYGGEELALLLPATELDAAKTVVDKLRAEIGAQPFSDGKVTVTVSGGVVERQPGESLASMLKRADDALYRAKAEGRDRVVIG